MIYYFESCKTDSSRHTEATVMMWFLKNGNFLSWHALLQIWSHTVCCLNWTSQTICCESFQKVALQWLWFHSQSHGSWSLVVPLAVVSDPSLWALQPPRVVHHRIAAEQSSARMPELSLATGAPPTLLGAQCYISAAVCDATLDFYFVTATRTRDIE